MPTLRKTNFFSILFLFLIPGFTLISSCERSVLVDNNMELPEAYWPESSKLQLEFEQSDTVMEYNFYITLRNTNDYPYRNLFVFLTTVFPNGKTKRDTINCPLATPQGKWLGKGFGGVYDNRILYLSKRRFPLPGTYKIQMEQAMRIPELTGVLDVGIRIEKAN